MNRLDVETLVTRLEGFPFVALCFREYVRWIVPKVSQYWSENDVIWMLEKDDKSRLADIEDRLTKSRQLLNISEAEFVRAFAFKDDLLSLDAEKVHDILAEPLLVLDLDRLGFRDIKKLPTFTGASSDKVRNADFTASYGSWTVAIELKTIRMENKPKPMPGKPLGYALKPNWWGDMFRRNAITKIEDKERRALSQLKNAQTSYNCDKTMLVLYTRRLGPSTLMTRNDYTDELEFLLARYPAIDYMAVKDYFGETVMVERQ